MIEEIAKNKVIREALRAYVYAVCDKEIVDRVRKRESVDHIADAIDLIDKVIDQMEDDFTVKKEQTQTNEAR